MINLDQKQLDEAQNIIRKLNHDLRKHIINYIDRHEPIRVTDIYQNLGLQQTVTSLHLGYLREIGVVSAERKGREMRYSVNKDRLEQIGEVLKEF